MLRIRLMLPGSIAHENESTFPASDKHPPHAAAFRCASLIATEGEYLEYREQPASRTFESPGIARISRSAPDHLTVEMGLKSEQQAFAARGLDFMTKMYLPARLTEMGVI